MTKSLNILLVSRRREVLESLGKLLGEEGVASRQQLNTNGHVDPLHGVEELPDLVILHLSHLWREELESFVARPTERRPALILIGASHDIPVMRLAMQAGARDVLPTPPAKADVLEAVARVASERRSSAPQTAATTTAFINAKGGCGATLLACNVAHMLAVESRKRVALFDLDLQFGAAPLYLDLYPKRGIGQAVENLTGLDEVALDGYLTRHASGLNVLSHAVDDPVSIGNLAAAAADHLIELAMRSHDQVIIDLPRRADPMTAAVVARANQLVVVVQQSVTALRDGARLLQWLRGDLGMTRDQLTIVINRFDKGAPISIDDVQKALACEQPVLVPNDFQSASECVNTGTPLLSYARNAAITKALLALQTRLGGASSQPMGGLLARTWSSLVSGRTK
jgi:pilus assembly protein CpaE